MSQPEIKINSDGSKHWFLNGQYHREGGPAIEWSDGSKEWCINGKLHREGGPAIEWASGRRVWFLNGKEFSFEDYIMELERLGLSERVVDLLFQIGQNGGVHETCKV